MGRKKKKRSQGEEGIEDAEECLRWSIPRIDLIPRAFSLLMRLSLSQGLTLRRSERAFREFGHREIM